MAARDELAAAIAERYSRAARTERGRILNEFTAVTGFQCKHAMRVLRAGQPTRRSGSRPDAGCTTTLHGSADRDLGGVGPDLRQAAESSGTRYG
jgi:hypothetical protein